MQFRDVHFGRHLFWALPAADTFELIAAGCFNFYLKSFWSKCICGSAATFHTNTSKSKNQIHFPKGKVKVGDILDVNWGYLLRRANVFEFEKIGINYINFYEKMFLETSDMHCYKRFHSFSSLEIDSHKLNRFNSTTFKCS